MKRSIASLLIISLICLGFSHGNLQPPPAQSSGYNTLAFYENWSGGTTDIDLSNTKVAGFKFYTNSAYPNAFANGTNWQGILTAPAMPSGNLSVSGGVLTIAGQTSGNNWQELQTCVWNGSAVIGSTFGNGFYLDIQFQFDPTTLTLGSPGWPIIWFAPKEFLNGSITNTNFVEIDGFEALAGSGEAVCNSKCQPTMTSHYWNTSNNTNDAYLFDLQTPITNNFNSWSFNTLHHYGLLWVPAAKNSGTGIIKRYLDGVVMTTLSYTSTGGTSPALTPSNPNGAMSEMDSENFCLFLGSGTGAAVKVGQVMVWQ